MKAAQARTRVMSCSHHPFRSYCTFQIESVEKAAKLLKKKTRITDGCQSQEQTLENPLHHDRLEFTPQA